MSKGQRTRLEKRTGANLGFEEKLWQAADKMRGHMDPAEYKHVVLRLIFLKYISDAFEERHQWLLKEAANPSKMGSSWKSAGLPCRDDLLMGRID